MLSEWLAGRRRLVRYRREGDLDGQAAAGPGASGDRGAVGGGDSIHNAQTQAVGGWVNAVCRVRCRPGGGIAHVAARELGAAAYAIKAVRAAVSGGERDAAGRLECLSQCAQLPDQIRRTPRAQGTGRAVATPRCDGLARNPATA